MKTRLFASALTAPVLMFMLALPGHAADTAATVTCKDGTTSTATGRGACSGHGGVQKAVKEKAAKEKKTSTSKKAQAAESDAQSSASATPAAAPAAAAKSTPKASKSAPAAAADGAAPSGATAKCKDGTYSKSKTHRGACSHHGGVAEWLN